LGYLGVDKLFIFISCKGTKKKLIIAVDHALLSLKSKRKK